MRVFIFIITLITFLSIQSSVFAVTATPSATPTPADEEVNSNLQDRIRNMVQQNVSTTEAKIKEKINELSLVGYAGKVTAVTAASISIDASGELFQVTANDETSIVNGGQKVKLSTIAIGDKIIVIGTINAKKDIISSKRIVIIKAATITDRPTVYQGTIQTVDAKKRTLTIKTATDSLPMVLSKKANLKIEDIVVGKNIFVIVRVQDVGKVITRGKIL